MPIIIPFELKEKNYDYLINFLKKVKHLSEKLDVQISLSAMCDNLDFHSYQTNRF